MFTHLLKGGGSRVEVLLREVLYVDKRQHRSSYFAVPSVNDRERLEETAAQYTQGRIPTDGSEDASSIFFTVGLVRDPCEYLVSMWAFQSMDLPPYGRSTGHGMYPRQCMKETHPNVSSESFYAHGRNTKSPLYIPRFRRWVRAAGGQRLHYMSYRSYLALHRKRWSKDDGQYFSCFGRVDAAVEDEAVATLATVDIRRRYDCLVHTERLEAETRACVRAYAEQLGDAAQTSRILTALANESVWKPRKDNKSPHLACSEYFDDETRDFVWAREGAFAKRVGYNSCCESGLGTHEAKT